MSCSDLKELCRNAAMSPVREAIRRASGDVESPSLACDQENVRLPFPRLEYPVTCCTFQGLTLRPLTTEDFLIQTVRSK